MEDKENRKRGKSDQMPGPIGAPADKPKEFLKTLKRIVKYIGKYNVALVIVIITILISTILAILSPKILGRATTELGNNIMQKMVYSQVAEMKNKLPEQVKQMIPQNATVQTLIDMKIMPDEVVKKIPDVAKSVSLNEEPRINFDYIGKVVLIVLALYVFSALLSYVASKVMSYVAQKVTYTLRKDIDNKLDKLPLRFYDKYTHGEILSRVTNDIDNIGNMLQQSLFNIVQSVFMIIGILVMMISINLTLTAIALVILPVALVFVGMVVKSSQKYFIEQQDVLGNINGHIEETYSGDVIVKSFNMQDKELEKFESLNDKLYSSGWKSQFLSGIMMPVINTINNLGYVGICVVGAGLAINGKITIGNIQAFIQYMQQFTQPIGQVANMVSLVQGTVASAERVFEVLDEQEEVLDPENPIKVDNVKGNVVCDNIKFSYKDEEDLIEEWSLDVKQGQTVAIVGPTGAGKTTMVNLLMRFYELKGGDIKIDGVSIKDMTKKDVRKMFAMVLQDTWLFNGTIRENLRYAKQDATDEEIDRAAELAHAHHFINALPGAYDFVLNEDATNISQGQKQLLTIARAILANSPMLILDEATSNVDTRTEHLIQKAMEKLMEGRTSFVIAHRLSTIKNADIILVMQHGRIVERGTHDELLARGGFYAKLYNSQFDEDIA